jgi:hypothetical protein
MLAPAARAALARRSSAGLAAARRADIDRLRVLR